jgi:uncharacterized protein (TIGR03086 family)
VHAIGDDQWALPTPCTDWDVRALIDHLVYETLWVPDLVQGKTLEEVGDSYDGERLGEDPVGAWEKAASAAIDAMGIEGATEGMVHTSGGEVPSDEYIGQMLVDAVIHGWDLAQSIGVDHHVDTHTASDLLVWFGPQAEAMQRYGAMAAPVEVPGDADDLTRLIALSGRTP